ncbi:glycosyltransferase family 4 protein [Arcicella aquatica]|uniref:Glycosyltransferase family 4 protein n=1 Tax=Arcicella aquatica TaxID=217141 RepID=A0ABU5QL09_9BACT|nr:glycosyltransferase family 4 protein [Arcicella aquatica]MEA5257745.1 glycosyltransferase family 4 protein [Arcicella aquatica]
MKKKIIYYTQVYYLDSALEYIQVASKDFDFHVYIEITPHALKANIFNIDADLTEYPLVIPVESVVKKWDIEYISTYLKNCKSCQFLNFSSPKSLDVDSLLRATKSIAGLYKLHADFVHLDDFSMRQIGMLPFFLLKKNSLILDVHDPKPHTGEKDIKKVIFSKILYKLTSKYLCLSEYSTNILKGILVGKKVYTIKFLPCSVYQNFIKKDSEIKKEYITFIGRISPYKGINLFIDAIKNIKDDSVKFMIAGKQIVGFDLSKEIPDNMPNLVVREKHLSNEEFVDIVQRSVLVVCPYLDATQSGVVMTAHALGCPVVVTPVGALPEYVDEGKNGIVSDDMSSEKLLESINKGLKEFNHLNQSLDDTLWTNYAASNLKVMHTLYS